MIEAATCQHEAVEKGHRETDALLRGLVLQHAARATAVPVQFRAFAPEEGRRAIGLPVDHVGHMAHHRCVQNFMHGLVVVEAAVMASLHAIARRERI